MSALGSGTMANITSGTVTLTLSPGTIANSGTISGTLSFTSTLGSVSQTFSGTYAGE
jgi:hypothetical protein